MQVLEESQLEEFLGGFGHDAQDGVVVEPQLLRRDQEGQGQDERQALPGTHLLGLTAGTALRREKARGWGFPTIRAVVGNVHLTRFATSETFPGQIHRGPE
jgi:hypothetical protein